MAKKYQLASLSKANQSLSTLIDEDLQKESELLKRLIKEVVEANQRVKESHMRRVEETKERLRIINKEIADLKDDIEAKDNATILEQFNALLKNKDQIYASLNDVRLFYSNNTLNIPQDHTLDHFKDTLIDTLTSHTKPISEPESFMQTFVTTAISLLDEHINKSEDYFSEFHSEQTGKTAWLSNFKDQADTFNTTFKSVVPKYKELLKTRTHFFSENLSDDALKDRVNTMYEETMAKLKHTQTTLEEDFITDFNQLEQELKTLEQDTLDTLKNKHSKRLEQEEKLKANLAKDLKQLRLDIIHAEKTHNAEEMQNLMRAYDRKEKSNIKLFEEKLKRVASQKTKAVRKKIIDKQKKLELNYIKRAYALKYDEEIEAIKFNDSHSLFKLREDQRAFKEDLNFIDNIDDFLASKTDAMHDFINDTLTFIDAFETLLLKESLTFLKTRTELVKDLEPLDQTFKTLQIKLLKDLRLKSFEQADFKLDLHHAKSTHLLKKKLYQDTQALDKTFTTELTSQNIETMRAQEDAQTDRIYQESLIEIAEKEYELQLIKIQSLFDNEESLTKAQAERLSVGLNVNDSMVRTTLESQMHFATQQIKFAESEYQVRLENIELSLSQELEYAEQKLRQHQQKYLTDRIELEKERDQKLEDLEYRLALFTSQKDRKKLNEQKENILSTYQTRIDEVTRNEENDPYVARYRKQIDAAKTRADKAQDDAYTLKERTIETFRDLLEKGEEKLQSFETSKSQSEKLIPYIETQSSSTAKERYDQALSEAQMQRDEKLEAPKEKIVALDERIKNLAESDELKALEADYQQTKAHLTTSYDQDLNRLNQDLQTKKEHLSQEKETFIESIETHLKSLQAPSKPISNNALLKELNVVYKTKEQRIKDSIATLRNDLKSSLYSYKTDAKTHLSTVKRTTKAMIRRYERYLRSVTKDHIKREKQIKKRLNDALNEEKLNIKAKYDN